MLINQVPFKEKFASLTIKVSEYEIIEIEDSSVLRNAGYVYILINSKIKFVINKCLSNFIEIDIKYKIYYEVIKANIIENLNVIMIEEV